MSERVRARRHHRSAQSSGWAVSPETFALFIPVILAVILMPLGMGGRHPFGEFFKFCSSSRLVRGLFAHQRNDAGWQLSILDFCLPLD